MAILYNIILLSVLPLIHRYFKYSLKDIHYYLTETLSINYGGIYLFDESYSDASIEWEPTENNKYHNKELPLKEYVLSKTKRLLYPTQEVNYIETILCNEKFAQKYQNEHYQGKETIFTGQDHKIMEEEYNNIMPKISNFAKFIEMYSIVEQRSSIIYFCLVIFSCYVICWMYIFIISYCFNPITFTKTIMYY